MGTRIELGTFIHDGQHLYEVIAFDKGNVLLENSMTEGLFVIGRMQLYCDPWKIAKPAPKMPDTIPADG